MELSQPADKHLIKSFLSLIKPGIIFGNAITAAGGFALASKGHFNIGLFLIALMGLSLIIGSGCAFNNYIDREADQKMKRTQDRPLAKGAISIKSAVSFAVCLVIAGAFLLAAFVNFITLVFALIGFAVYVFWYSFAKYRTVHGTLIGSIAGAVPPVVGYCAVSNRFDLGAFILFIMIALWQMPHFYAIAIYRLEEYSAASIPVLPIKKGILAAKIQMLLYVAAFVISSLSLTFFGYTGITYAIIVTILGAAWIGQSVSGFKTHDDKRWARQMFISSLIIVTILCAILPFAHIL